MEWIHLPQDGVQLQAFVNSIMTLPVKRKEGDFLIN